VNPTAKKTQKNTLSRPQDQVISLKLGEFQSKNLGTTTPDPETRIAPTLRNFFLDQGHPKPLFGAKNPISPPTQPLENEQETTFKIPKLRNFNPHERSSGTVQQEDRLMLPIETEEGLILGHTRTRIDLPDDGDHITNLPIDRDPNSTKFSIHNDKPIDERKSFWGNAVGKSHASGGINKVFPQKPLVAIHEKQTMSTKKVINGTESQNTGKLDIPKRSDSNRIRFMAELLLSKPGNIQHGNQKPYSLKLGFSSFKNVMDIAKKMLLIGSRYFVIL
jgi:hypothetical protein